MQLAEFNVAKLLAPLHDRRVRDFVNNINRINNLGRRMPGFVWIMQDTGAPNARTKNPTIFDDESFVSNLTVWEDLPSLERFVFDTLHRNFMERGSEWFEVLQERHFVMWWVEPGHQPRKSEAIARLEHLRIHGDSMHAFGWDYARAHQKAHP